MVQLDRQERRTAQKPRYSPTPNSVDTTYSSWIDRQIDELIKPPQGVRTYITMNNIDHGRALLFFYCWVYLDHILATLNIFWF